MEQTNQSVFFQLVFCLGLSFVDVICWVPMVGRLLFKGIQFFHQEVTSDIPGIIS
jgi:hypothetical protein